MPWPKAILEEFGLWPVWMSHDAATRAVAEAEARSMMAGDAMGASSAMSTDAMGASSAMATDAMASPMAAGGMPDSDMAMANDGSAMGAPMMAGGKTIKITIKDVITGQPFSPTYAESRTSASAPLFKLGDKASDALVAVAERHPVAAQVRAIAPRYSLEELSPLRQFSRRDLAEIIQALILVRALQRSAQFIEQEGKGVKYRAILLRGQMIGDRDQEAAHGHFQPCLFAYLAQERIQHRFAGFNAACQQAIGAGGVKRLFRGNQMAVGTANHHANLAITVSVAERIKETRDFKLREAHKGLAETLGKAG